MEDDMAASGSTAEFLLANPEALLAGTLALMTGLIQGCCEEHRPMIRRKVIANLAELERHTGLSPQFRAVASHLQQHWFALDAGKAPQACGDRKLWQEPAGTIQ